MITNGKFQDWRTPRLLFNTLHRERRYTRDCFASIGNHLLPRYWTSAHGPLRRRRMYDETGFGNPPFGMIYAALEWGYESCQMRGEGFVTFILPGNFETDWFRDLATLGRKTLFHRRVAYEAPPGVDASSPSFGSILVEYGPDVIADGIGFTTMRHGRTGEVIDYPQPRPRLIEAIKHAATDVVYGGAAADVTRFTLNPKPDTFKIATPDERKAWTQATAGYFAP